MLFKKAALTATALALSLTFAPALTGVDSAQAQSERKTKRVPAMGSRVYDQLARAQSIADEGDVPQALEVLDRVKSKISSMNSYEIAMMHNFYGFVYYNAEDFDNAIKSFEAVVAQEPIPEPLQKSTLYSLAQLNMMRGNYDKTVEMLERWEALNQGAAPAKNLVLKAQAMYQKKDYAAAARYIDEAVLQVENSEEGYQVDENWYVLQRAVYFELKQPERVTRILEKMVRLFNEPKYWVQLGGMYGELGEEKKQLAIMEAAYQQGFVTSAGDLFNLAQLYYYHQVPYKGALLMEQAMQDGVLESNLRNLRFLANSWSLAKEEQKAVPVLQAAADLAENGELDAQLGQMYLNMDKYDQAIASSEVALQKGGLRNVGTTHLVMGMALFNQGKYAEALNQLAEAEKHNSSRGVASQWKRFVESEQKAQAILQADS